MGWIFTLPSHPTGGLARAGLEWAGPLGDKTMGHLRPMVARAVGYENISTIWASTTGQWLNTDMALYK